MSPTPPSRTVLTDVKPTIAETHYGSDEPDDPEIPVSPKKTKKFYTPDMQRKIAQEYDRASDKRTVLTKYDISMSAVCRWIRDGILDNGAEPAATARSEAILGREMDLAELLWLVVAKARAAGDISKEDAKRLLELVL